MKHSATLERALIVGNTFSFNAGYIDSSVIYIRARGPVGKDVYDVLGTSAEAFCGGYLIQQNTFKNNFGCVKYVGGVIRMECVNDGEVSANWHDRISTPATANFVQDSFTDLNVQSVTPTWGTALTFTTTAAAPVTYSY